MYIKPRPVGTNPPNDEDRRPIWKVYSGDAWVLTTNARFADEVPATPDNSRVIFTLSQDRFATEPFWVGEWNDGIEEVDPSDHPGLVKIHVADEISDTLRRGSYNFSVVVSDIFGRNTYTNLEGYLLVEYSPGSPNHSIPYKDGTGGSDIGPPVFS